jgi:hypothetical protein
MADKTHGSSVGGDLFPQEVEGLQTATPSMVVPLSDGAVYALRIGPVRKRIAGGPVRMLAYNGSIPGPLLRVKQGTTITVEVTDDADLEQTVHWHGLRLENRFDGVPYETQQPIPGAADSEAGVDPAYDARESSVMAPGSLTSLSCSPGQVADGHAAARLQAFEFTAARFAAGGCACPSPSRGSPEPAAASCPCRSPIQAWCCE